MVDFKHACFISWKEPPRRGAAASRHFRQRFVVELKKQIESYLDTGLGIYVSTELEEKPGVPYPSELAEKLCMSVCMVAVLVPQYLESRWCVGEWRGMEKLEQKRLGNGKMGLIIPIIHRGERDQMEAFAGVRTLRDFSAVQVPQSQLKTVRNQQRIEWIAQQIDRHVEKIESKGAQCADFSIPLGAPGAAPVVHDDPDPMEQ